MTMMMDPSRQYREQSIQTATQGELTLMLFNGCIRFLRLGIRAIDKKDVAEAHENISRAQAIICELMMSLNMEYEPAESFMSLYTYMYRQLISANIKKEKEPIHVVIELITELKDGWEKAIKQPVEAMRSMEG